MQGYCIMFLLIFSHCNHYESYISSAASIRHLVLLSWVLSVYGRACDHWSCVGGYTFKLEYFLLWILVFVMNLCGVLIVKDAWLHQTLSSSGMLIHSCWSRSPYNPETPEMLKLRTLYIATSVQRQLAVQDSGVQLAGGIRYRLVWTHQMQVLV